MGLIWSKFCVACVFKVVIAFFNIESVLEATIGAWLRHWSKAMMQVYLLPVTTVVWQVGATVSSADLFSVQSLLRVIGVVKSSYKRYSPCVAVINSGASCHTYYFQFDGCTSWKICQVHVPLC